MPRNKHLVLFQEVETETLKWLILSQSQTSLLRLSEKKKTKPLNNCLGLRRHSFSS